MYAVLEEIQGPTLYEFFGQHGALELDEVVEFANALGKTIAWAHRQDPPLIHRDIKPDNLILRAARLDDPVLLDFGLVAGPIVSSEKVTGIGEQIENALRLPELIEAEGSALPQSDIAQFAGLLFFMLSRASDPLAMLPRCSAALTVPTPPSEIFAFSAGTAATVGLAF